MRVFQIWCEGYVSEAGEFEAERHGEIEASSFREACDTWFANDPAYEPTTVTHEGRRCFDNEWDARVAFG